LGIEALPRRDAAPLIRAWHQGAAALPGHFRAWASAPVVDPDLDELGDLLADDRFVGLQLPATQLLGPTGWEQVAPVVRLAEHAGKPVLVHPGPVARPAGERALPGWWPPVVGYVGQLQAAWWSWVAVRGRELFPDLRLVFAAAAGLAPVHHERHVVRGGEDSPVDPAVFVDTSGYGPRALDAVVRVLGIDALVLGSDRPYAEPLADLFGDAATYAIREANPVRLLDGPAAHVPGGGDVAWPSAS
jgi:predicted TIM-barrel fold metal-dependent hydrolase